MEDLAFFETMDGSGVRIDPDIVSVRERPEVPIEDVVQNSLVGRQQLARVCFGEVHALVDDSVASPAGQVDQENATVEVGCVPVEAERPVEFAIQRTPVIPYARGAKAVIAEVFVEQVGYVEIHNGVGIQVDNPIGFHDIGYPGTGR